jgi:UDP-N-acetylglucosamine 2-epimerase
MPIKVMTVFGTRPEAIKMAPALVQHDARVTPGQRQRMFM